METIEKNDQMNVNDWSMVTLNDFCFGDVTMSITKHCLHIYNPKGWVGLIPLEDIKTFTSNDSKINSEVNRFILEQISK